MKKFKLALSVFAIIVVIVFVIPSFMPFNCVFISAHSQLNAIVTALKLFNLDTGRYPTESEGLKVLVYSELAEKINGYKPDGYLEDLGEDPWGNEYRYYRYKLVTGKDVAVVWTFGADNLPNGENHEKDIFHVVMLKGDIKK